ncbi:hypothetical protein LUZ62_027366 [Rhynchospora pubera]|uniref:X8 domain-containing protein n=1 Tax=Rhynchospora pubera TaxID=906938 RepID=A0AAV8HFZ2_9POAL|nr:hypothetical protein LUZ62_027366 [Rhynchospora pubera]
MLLVNLLLLTLLLREDLAQGATWCIARSGSNQTALQLAIDYACGSGLADCAPVQSSGLCYLPNTMQAHASYAFNSYYQRSNAAPGSCDFGGTAVVTVTDPSYGSCTYPSSASSAGSSPSQSTPSNNPITTPGTTPSTTPFSPPFGTGTGSSSSGPGFGGFSPPDYNSATTNPNHTSLFFSLVLGTCLFYQLVSN